MFRNSIAKVVFSLVVFLSTVSYGLPVNSQDLVPSEDLTGGASVFVFRKSRKAPQEKAGARAFIKDRASRARTGGRRVNAQLASAARKKRFQKRSVSGKRTTARRRNAKIALSNTLTAKADGLLDTQQTDKAITSYREAIRANPNNQNAIEGLSEALTIKGIDVAGNVNNDAAIIFLAEAVKLDPKNELAYAKAGEIYAAKQLNAQAVENYEQALAIDPQMSTIFVPLGLIYVELGDIAKADLLLPRIDAVLINTGDAYYLRGLVRYKQNRNPEAVEAFEKARTLDPTNQSASYYLAASYDRVGRPDDSAVAYQKIVETDPTFGPAWFDLGVMHYNRGEYEKAVNAYGQSINAGNSGPEVHANLASTYRQLERYPEANAEYKLAEPGYKNDPDLYSEWGFCLGKTQEWDKSVARLETAEQLSPSAVDHSNVGWGYYNAAQKDKAAKNDAEATAKLEKSKLSLQKAVEKDPKLDAAYVNLGSTNNALGDFEAAVAALNVALSLHGDWPIALNQLGLGYRGLNNLTGAIQAFTRVVNIDGNNVGGLFNLGSAQYASGDKKGAKKTQERLKKLDAQLANQLGNIIAGRLIEEGKRQILKKVPIPGLPF